MLVQAWGPGLEVWILWLFLRADPDRSRRTPQELFMSNISHPKKNAPEGPSTPKVPKSCQKAFQNDPPDERLAGLWRNEATLQTHKYLLWFNYISWVPGPLCFSIFRLKTGAANRTHHKTKNKQHVHLFCKKKTQL